MFSVLKFFYYPIHIGQINSIALKPFEVGELLFLDPAMFQSRMLNVKNLSYSYDGKSTIAFPNFDVNQGETLLVLGESGKGKTTLLHLMGGIISPQKGDILLKGKNFGKLKGADLDKFRAEHIGIVFQEAHFIRSLDVIDNLKLVQKLSGDKIDEPFILALLEKVGLQHRANHYTSKLSQGEKQRLNILRAIITRPTLLLADEPTSALDDTNCERVMTLLEDLTKEVTASLIIVTHDNRLKKRFDHKIELT
jgi:putative ABC transport system ATP-binding protein